MLKLTTTCFQARNWTDFGSKMSFIETLTSVKIVEKFYRT